MLTPSERRFIQSWKEQREGPAWKYYLIYTIAWGTVSFLALFFLVKLIMSDRSMGGWISFYIVLASAIAISFLITHFTYRVNEKKYKIILQKEKQAKSN